MKSNAPKKIYLQEPTKVRTEKKYDNDVEYARTDAFIEKACDAYCAICDTKECEGCAECSWVIKFRRQLEKL